MPVPKSNPDHTPAERRNAKRNQIPANGLTKDPQILMFGMGSRTGKYTAFSLPMHRSFMDRRQPETNRILAALWDRTLVPADDFFSSLFAREKDGRPTKAVHLVAATGMKASNVSAALKRLEEEGKIRREDGKIYLLAEVPAPELGTSDDEEQTQKVIYADKWNARKVAFYGRLEQNDPQQFRFAMQRFVGQELYNKQRQADAMAWTREREAEEEELRDMESGYTDEETRGRKRKRPASFQEAFKPALAFEQYFVQNEERITLLAAPISVRDGKVIVNRIKKNSEHNPHPYELTSNPLTEEQLAVQGKVNPSPDTPQAELPTKAARTEITDEINATLNRSGLRKHMGASSIDAATVANMATQFLRVPQSHIAAVMGALEDRARDIATGKKSPEKGPAAYLFSVVKQEVEAYLRKHDVREQVKDAAKTKSMAKSRGAGA